MGFLGPTWFVGEEDAPTGCTFHYTSRTALTRILKTGVLRPHKAMPDDRVALVWFSTAGTWEPASGRPVPWNAMRPMGFDAMAAGGLARLLVGAEVGELDWPALRRLVSPAWLQLLAGYGGAWVRDNAHRWSATRHAVGQEHWLAVEVWRAPRWVSCSKQCEE
jgi:hypothetical protein